MMDNYSAPKQKIVNDPVHGFITIDHPLLFKVIGHPYYQRLRRIHQMALASLVYPGAVHSRLLHSLGAYHLMSQALQELKRKGTDITDEECVAAKIAILLHDIGHGPYSHALEGLLVQGVHHEEMSLAIMQKLNREFNGELDLAISIFQNTYHKSFLHQLVSGQLDVDRMDYLSRDSYFSGVSEGVIGYDRIIKMLVVHNNQLMVEEKAIYSIEKFLMARRLMYWQVYLHKTVLAAEQTMVQIIKRAKRINAGCHQNLAAFLQAPPCTEITDDIIDRFCQVDDEDIMMAIKQWINHEDVALSRLCQGVLNRRLYKRLMQDEPFDEAWVAAIKENTKQKYGVSDAVLPYFVFTGMAKSTTYNKRIEPIHILYKDGTVKDISEIYNGIIDTDSSATVGRYYICWIE